MNNSTTIQPITPDELTAFSSWADSIVSECSKVIVGKEDVIRKVLISYLCGGHVLLEDLPGTGKTMLLRAFSQVVGGEFHRIQFTPDLLPSDLTGINFYNQKSGEFQFRKGPLFADVILADEINRATPRTQSSLLEAMEEHQITVDGTTYPLAKPYFVMASQNPLESQGTFPLPEAQIDRFFMRLTLGYMSKEQEISVLMRPASTRILEDIKPIVTRDETLHFMELLNNITVSETVAGYLMDIIWATRKQSKYHAGVSTRGALALYHASQVCAAMEGRSFVIPEDVKAMAIPVLAHRVSGNMGIRSEAEAYMNKILSEVAVPLEKQN